MGVDFLFSMFLSGKSGDTYVDPATGKNIEIPAGKTLADIDPEADSFYKALGDTKVTGDLHTAIGDIYTSYLDIPEGVVSRADFKGLEIAYRNYEANSNVANAASFLDEAGRVYARAWESGYRIGNPYDTINTAIEADFAARQNVATDIGNIASGIEASVTDIGTNTYHEGDGGKHPSNMLQSNTEDSTDMDTKVNYLNQYAADNEAYDLQLSSEDILKTSGGRLDLAEKLILATKEVIPGKTIPELVEMLNIPKNPEPSSLSIYQARIWYLYQEALIESRLDYSKPLEQVARDAVEMRNQIRTQTREYMFDRAWAEYLNLKEKNKTFDELVNIYYDRGFSGDELWNEIIKGSMSSRDKVNILFYLLVKE